MARVKGQAEVERTGQALQQLVIEYVDPNDPEKVRPNDYNPNRQNEHEFELLKRSIEEDGFTQPVIVAEDGVIVDGEHRWRAARALGIPAIPVVRVPMEAAQARIATLRHNRARGSEDLELSVEVLRDLERLGALDWAAHSLDLSDAEIERLLSDVPAPEALAGEEFGEAWAPDTEKLGVDWTTSLGMRYDATPESENRIRMRDAAIKAARTEEEKDKARSEANVYRIGLTYAGDEADVVRDVLGTTPAINLLAVCRYIFETKADVPGRQTVLTPIE